METGSSYLTNPGGIIAASTEACLSFPEFVYLNGMHPQAFQRKFCEAVPTKSRRGKQRVSAVIATTRMMTKVTRCVWC